MSEIRTDTINNASGDNDSGIDLSTNDQVKIKTANTTALTVDASQNVGIGTSSPTGFSGYTSLDINNATNGALIDLSQGDSMKGRLIATASSMAIETASSVPIIFQPTGSEAIRIDSSGNLLLNTTSSTGHKMTVVADASAGAIDAVGSPTNGYYAFRVDMPSTNTYGVLFRNNGNNVGDIRVNSSSTSYNTSSDHRLKENVTADWDATTRLKQLNPVRFNFIADADTTVDGFLAHEVQSVVPEAISGTHNEVDADGNPVYQGIDQSKLVPLLVKTIQELEARITALENGE